MHISGQTSGYATDTHPIRCMADGEVVAYRLDNDYLTSTWGEGDQAKQLKYSTSFCLLPYKGYASPEAATGSNAPALARPGYWQSTHPATGRILTACNARHDPTGTHIGGAIHTVPAGSTVEILQTRQLKLGTVTQPFAQVKLVTLGSDDAGTLSAGQTVWVSGQSRFLARDAVVPDTLDSIVVCDKPHAISAGDPVGYLGLYETPSDSASVMTHRFLHRSGR